MAGGQENRSNVNAGIAAGQGLDKKAAKLTPAGVSGPNNRPEAARANVPHQVDTVPFDGFMEANRAAMPDGPFGGMVQNALHGFNPSAAGFTNPPGTPAQEVGKAAAQVEDSAAPYPMATKEEQNRRLEGATREMKRISGYTVQSTPRR